VALRVSRPLKAHFGGYSCTKLYMSCKNNWLYKDSNFSYTGWGTLLFITKYSIQIKRFIIRFYRCRMNTQVLTGVELQSSVRIGWWRPVTAPTGEFMFPEVKRYIFDWSTAYQVECKTIPVEASTDPDGSWSLRFPDFETIGKWKWLGCQPYAPAAIIPNGIYLVLISVRGWVENRASVLPEVFWKRNFPMTPSRIQTATFRLWAHCLNQLALVNQNTKQIRIL
jgi:hypothetical protein